MRIQLPTELNRTIEAALEFQSRMQKQTQHYDEYVKSISNQYSHQLHGFADAAKKLQDQFRVPEIKVPEWAVEAMESHKAMLEVANRFQERIEQFKIPDSFTKAAAIAEQFNTHIEKWKSFKISDEYLRRINENQAMLEGMSKYIRSFEQSTIRDANSFVNGLKALNAKWPTLIDVVSSDSDADDQEVEDSAETKLLYEQLRADIIELTKTSGQNTATLEAILNSVKTSKLRWVILNLILPILLGLLVNKISSEFLEAKQTQPLSNVNQVKIPVRTSPNRRSSIIVEIEPTQKANVLHRLKYWTEVEFLFDGRRVHGWVLTGSIQDIQ